VTWNTHEVAVAVEAAGTEAVVVVEGIMIGPGMTPSIHVRPIMGHAAIKDIPEGVILINLNINLILPAQMFSLNPTSSNSMVDSSNMVVMAATGALEDTVALVVLTLRVIVDMVHLGVEPLREGVPQITIILEVMQGEAEVQVEAEVAMEATVTEVAMERQIPALVMGIITTVAGRITEEEEEVGN